MRIRLTHIEKREREGDVMSSVAQKQKQKTKKNVKPKHKKDEEKKNRLEF